MRTTIAREAMLDDIRQALKSEGKSASQTHHRDSYGSAVFSDQITETQRSDNKSLEELISQFACELKKVGGSFHRASTTEEAFQVVKTIAADLQAKTMVAFGSRLFDQFDLPKRVRECGVEFAIESDRDFIGTATTADIGLSGVDYALAETGTLVLLARRGQARAISLLPPVHIAVVKAEQVIPGLSDLFPLLRPDTKAADNLSSAVTFITGPSRTADIELTLVVGVHGPQQLHVIMIQG